MTRPAHHKRTGRVALFVLIDHHSKRDAAGKRISDPDAPRLRSKDLYRLIRKHHPEALFGWRSFGPRSAFDKLLCDVLAFWYEIDET